MSPNKILQQQSLQTQIHMAFQGSLLNCFEELDKIILSYPAKDLTHAFPQMLELFFNFEGACPDEMNFGRLTSSNSYDFQVARRFFDIHSPLLSLAFKLSADPNCYSIYEFPFANLPATTRNSILSGRIPSFYSNKIKNSLNKTIPESILLDAFDLFMFHFAYYVVNPHNWRIMHMVRESYRSEWIISSLVNSYLNAFFPPNQDILPVRIVKFQPAAHQSEVLQNQSGEFHWSSDGNVRSSPKSTQNHSLDGSSFHLPYNNSMQQQQQSISNTNDNVGLNFFQQQFNRLTSYSTSSSPHYHSSSPRPYQSPYARACPPPRVSRLLNLDPQLLSQVNSIQSDSNAILNEQPTTANLAFQGDIFSGSDAVLQVFVDFWLNQFDPSTLEQNVWLTNKMLKMEDFLLLVRLLVKHFHLFVNSAIDDRPIGSWGRDLSTNHGSPTFVRNAMPTQQQRPQLLTQEQREWNDFKRSIWSPWLCSKLYNFLKYNFMYGPMERPLMEIWLSFIQPWRYTQQQQQGLPNTPQQQPQHRDGGDRFMEPKWTSFMRRHLLFYTTFLELALERFLSLDLMSPVNSLVISRVAKVFSIRLLKEGLQEVEMSLERMNLSGSYLDTSRTGNERILTTELEGDGFRYKPLFSDAIKSQVIRLITNIMVARETLENQLITYQLEVKGRSWLQRIMSAFSSDEDMNVVSVMEKSIDQLGVSANHILVFFEISIASLPRQPIPAWSQRQTTMTSTLHHHDDAMDNLPDLRMNEDGTFVLTPLGRHEILTKRKKFDLEYKGDPDLQPIRSFEFAPLVRFLYMICENINGKYAREIQRATEKSGLSGMAARRLFCDPVLKSKVATDRSSPRDNLVGFTTPRRRLNGSILDRDSPPKLILSPNGVLTNKPTGGVPRLSLRFLAKYSSLFMIFLTLMVIKIWFGLDFMGVFIAFGLFIMACIAIVSRIVLSSRVSEQSPGSRRSLFSEPDD